MFERGKGDVCWWRAAITNITDITVITVEKLRLSWQATYVVIPYILYIFIYIIIQYHFLSFFAYRFCNCYICYNCYTRDKTTIVTFSLNYSFQNSYHPNPFTILHPPQIFPEGNWVHDDLSGWRGSMEKCQFSALPTRDSEVRYVQTGHRSNETKDVSIANIWLGFGKFFLRQIGIFTQIGGIFSPFDGRNPLRMLNQWRIRLGVGRDKR